MIENALDQDPGEIRHLLVRPRFADVIGERALRVPAVALQLPAGVQGPKNVSPQVVRNLPPALHEAYVRAVAEALHPVFVVASVIAIFAFLLTWLLREVPLRDSARPASGEDLAGTASAEPAAVTASQRG